MKTKLLRKARKDADNTFRITKHYDQYGENISYKIDKFMRYANNGFFDKSWEPVIYSKEYDYILKCLYNLKRGYILNNYINNIL